MTSPSHDLPTSDVPVRGRARGWDVVPGLMLVGLGVAWVTKGVVSLAEGLDASYWGDDFVYGLLYLAMGALCFYAARRRAAVGASR